VGASAATGDESIDALAGLDGRATARNQVVVYRLRVLREFVEDEPAPALRARRRS
jgi:hypothetical protein